MSQKFYVNVLKVGVWAALIVVFFVFKNLLFPFITSKQISFNILIEVLFVFWLALIIKYPEYRPRRDYIGYGLAAFFAALLVSSVLGVDWNLSFWGDIERMLGLFHLLHFFVFYLIIITVMRTWSDWKWFLTWFIIIAGIEGWYSAVAPKGYGTIGNTAYVSGYMLFGMYLSLLLFFKESNKVWRWLYLLPIWPMMSGFVRANTTGAWVGLGISTMALLFFYGILYQNRKVKIITWVAFILGVAFVANFFIFNRDNFLTHHSRFFARLVREVNFNKNTFQTRLISWRAALKDFPHHPIFGTGHGNYSITFDKYFSSKFYDYTRGETYFDRAHNNLIDIASTAGAVGLLAYLSIFAAVAVYLIKSYRAGKIDVNEFVVIIGLFTAYFVQNLAVFDSLVTYISLMVTLGYVYWLWRIKDEEIARTKDREWENREVYVLFGVGLIILVIMNQYNVKVLKMLVHTIGGQRAFAQGMVEKTIKEYRKALSYHTPLDRDSRTSMNRLFISNPDSLKKLDREKAQEILDYNIAEAEKNVRYNPHDSLLQLVLAQLLNVAANFNRDNPEKFQFYSDRALEAIDKAIAASPERIPVYFQKAQILMNRGEKDKVIEEMEAATKINPRYEDAFCYLAKIYLYYNEKEKGYQNLDKCLDMNGARLFRQEGLIKSFINHYVDQKDWPRVIALYKQLTKIEKKNADNWTRLARVYAEAGQKDKAREAAEKAMEIDPSIKKYAEEFIRELGD